MAQLPPKSPAMAQKWPSFTYQMMPTPVSQPPSWMDDFVDYSSAKRGSHRRSASDPVAFVETPFANDQCGDSNGSFERLDDEQLCSMFSDDFTPNFQSMKSSPNACDQNSDNEEVKQQLMKMKSEPGEVEDGGGYEHESESVKAFSGDGGTIVDPKRVKRYVLLVIC